MGFPDASFEPNDPGPTALFLDTSGLFAYFNPDVDSHEIARSFLRRVGANEIPYRPLYTSTYVIDELVTLLRSKGRRRWATGAFETLTESNNFTILSETDERFEAAGERFRQFDDHDISFTDCLCAVQMEEENVDHVFAYDDDYGRLGFDVVPRPTRG